MNSLRIYNTLARDKQPFVPLRAGEVRMYVCGITVYDYCHVGHARMLTVFDIVQRWLRTIGYSVTYVRNITDIDDKIIRRAVENGEPIKALTQRFIDAMYEDTDALGIERPDLEPRATDFIPQMLGMIQTLEQKGYAYHARDGDVNYAVRKFAGYGKLSGKSIEDLRAGELSLLNKQLITETSRTVLRRERMRQPLGPLLPEGLDLGGRQAIADLLKPLGIGATANAVVERFEGDAFLGQLTLDVFVPVEA